MKIVVEIVAFAALVQALVIFALAVYNFVDFVDVVDFLGFVVKGKACETKDQRVNFGFVDVRDSTQGFFENIQKQ